MTTWASNFQVNHEWAAALVTQTWSCACWTDNIWMKVLKSWLSHSLVEGVKCQHSMSPVASRQNPMPIEVYSSSNSTLPTKYFFDKRKLRSKKRRKTEKQGLASGEALCTQKRIAASKSRSIKMPQHWTDPKREMHSDMFLLVVCYASPCSCLWLFFPPLYEICQGSKRSVLWRTNTSTV